MEERANKRRLEKGNIDDDSGSVIVCVVENRAREVCIVKIDTTKLSTIELYLMSDTHSYTECVTTLRYFQPNEILLHDGTRGRVLSNKVLENFPPHQDCRVVFISRQYFDQDRGADLLKKVVAGHVDADLISKYTAVAGSYCLLRYVENCSGINFASHSIRVEYGSGAIGRRMIIDRNTAACLELINNAISGSQKQSLFDAINFTKTVVGARLLRASLLRPLTDVASLETRLDMVEMLLKNNGIFNEVVEVVGRFPDLDKMLSGLCATPKTCTARTARIGIDTLIFVKHAIKTADALASALGYSQGSSGTQQMIPLLAAFLSNL